LNGIEDRFQQRVASSPSFAALTEEASVAAVSTASDEYRRDLAALLHHGLFRDDAEILEEQALLHLRDRINDAQVILLMSYGNFRQTMGDTDQQDFWDAHPGLFDVHPPLMNSSPDEIRRWTMKEHYGAELESLGLLKDSEGIAKSGRVRNYEITALGRLLLDAIGRYRDPRSSPRS
jgi:hypothetical protein